MKLGEIPGHDEGGDVAAAGDLLVGEHYQLSVWRDGHAHGDDHVRHGVHPCRPGAVGHVGPHGGGGGVGPAGPAGPGESVATLWSVHSSQARGSCP